MPDAPISTTLSLELGQWAEGADPGFEALNENWDTIDAAVMMHGTSLPLTYQVGKLFLHRTGNGVIKRNTGTLGTPVWTDVMNLNSLTISDISGLVAALAAKADDADLTTLDATVAAFLGLLTTKGDLLARTAGGLVRLPVGANDKILKADSGEATGLKWDDESGGGGGGSVAGTFQGRLDTADGVSDTLTLNPYQGILIEVALEMVDLTGGFTRDIADNLIDVDGTDLGSAPAASTLYYVYVSNSLAAFSPLSIRLSATAPQEVDGVRYLDTSGDGLNWRFVGWIKTNATPQFESTLLNRLIVNAYNKQDLALENCPGYNDGAGNITQAVNSTAWVEILGAGSGEVHFISDGENAIALEALFSTINDTPGIIGGIGIDSATEPESGFYTGGTHIPGMSTFRRTLTEGDHYGAMLVAFGGSGPSLYLQIDKTAFTPNTTHDIKATLIRGAIKG